MDTGKLQDAVMVVLRQVQADSGLPCPELTSETKPVDDLPQFDSKVWPVATTMLSTSISVPIPNDVNIFVDDQTMSPRSISQITTFLAALLSRDSKAEAGAA